MLRITQLVFCVRGSSEKPTARNERGLAADDPTLAQLGARPNYFYKETQTFIAFAPINNLNFSLKKFMLNWPTSQIDLINSI